MGVAADKAIPGKALCPSEVYSSSSCSSSTTPGSTTRESNHRGDTSSFSSSRGSKRDFQTLVDMFEEFKFEDFLFFHHLVAEGLNPPSLSSRQEKGESIRNGGDQWEASSSPCSRLSVQGSLKYLHIRCDPKDPRELAQVSRPAPVHRRQSHFGVCAQT